MNAAVELHDSDVVAVEAAGTAVVVRLAAYVHRSDGRPGMDPGSGWSQPVELVFTGGQVEERPAELPCTLDDGRVSGGAEFAGIVPLPASVNTAVQFEAQGLCGERLTVRGTGLEVVAVGDGTFIESFPGTRQAVKEKGSGVESRPNRVEPSQRWSPF
jgi:hypothetical protein